MIGVVPSLSNQVAVGDSRLDIVGFWGKEVVYFLCFGEEVAFF